MFNNILVPSDYEKVDWLCGSCVKKCDLYANSQAKNCSQ